MLRRFENLCAWLLGSALELLFSSKATDAGVQAAGHQAGGYSEDDDELRPYSLRKRGDWHFRHATDPAWRAF